MAGIRPPQRVRIHGGNPNPPIESEVIPQLLRGHVQGGGGWDPKQAMIMTCSPSLPLGSMPKVLETEERTKHVLGEGFESQVQVSRDDMRVSLHVLPHDLLPDLLSGRSIDVILWEVPLEVLPLHVGTAEGQKHRCLVPRQKNVPVPGGHCFCSTSMGASRAILSLGARSEAAIARRRARPRPILRASYSSSRNFWTRNNSPQNLPSDA